MKPVIRAFCCVLFAVVFMFAIGIPSHAQDGKLNVRVTPHQTYIFVDGRAISEASKKHTLSLSAGDHKVELVNYGYTPDTRTVTITAGKTTDIEVNLTPVSKTVSGPFGAMTIEDANRDAILLNGKTPDFFVGHGDEFDHDWWWKQELVVPPGNYQVTALHEDKVVWSGPVDVPANKRVVIDIPKGVRKTVDWPRGAKLTSIPRFAVGSASATVAVAQPTAELSTTAAQINCGDSSQLKWASTDAPNVQITPLGTVAASGEQTLQPKQTTEYHLTALGPGGTATANTKVNVNTAVQANLELSPAQVQYKKIGDKVVQQDSTALNWTAANASNVSIDPLGTVSPTGNQTLQIVPKKTDPGPVDETATYTLNAKNDCGGTATQTATLHIVGSIEPPELAMRSVFFPTNRPRSLKSTNALLASEQETLKSIAEGYQKYLQYKPDARLTLVGHADQRGPQAYNQPLSERRAQLAKAFLVQQGVPEGNIETQAYGKEKNLTADQVKELIEKDSSLSAEEREKLDKKFQNTVLAFNRRVDLTVTPTGQESAVTYPVQSEDFAKLIDRGPKLAFSGVELAAEKEKETKETKEPK
jgi:outer membrane protein OmpA-like peptidoglycan-associated protein